MASLPLIMQDWVQQTISTRRLKLTKKQFLFHYFFVVFLPLFVILTVILILNSLQLKGSDYDSIKNSTLKFCSFFSFAYAIVQYTRLQMTSVPSTLTKSEFEKTTENLIKDMNWILEAKGDNYFVCTTPFKWYNWGTLITVVYTDEAIMFNSICDLHNRPATLSFGQNSKNYRALNRAFDLVL